ncbi:MAG TPA: hypothetical protein VIQ54_31575 [Polyangia bacterium]|jgi:hypothetical protein
MGKAFGLVLFLGTVLLAPACGEVTASDAQQTQACAKKAGGRGHGAAGTGADCAAATGGGATGEAGRGGGGMTGASGAAGAMGAVATDVVEFPCTVCRKAENCCKAEGFTDCGYTAACASAMNASQVEFYVALCRAMLRASVAKKTPDACGM